MWLTAAFVPTSTEVDTRHFLWDANQNKLSRIDERDDPGNTNLRRYDYTYDPANRLLTSTFYPTGDTPPSPQVSYELEGVHNRTRVTDTVSSDEDGRYYLLDGVPDPADFQVNQYTLTTRNAQMYDANGNLTTIQPLCDADLNLDGIVDVLDFSTFLHNFGHCDPSFTWQDGNLDGDPNGCVNVYDFAIFSRSMGNVCYPDEISYDYRNQMVRYVDDAGGEDEATHAYRYDCFGRRLGKKLDTANSTAEQRYYYGGQAFWQLCEVRTYPDAASAPEDFTLDGTFVHGPQFIDEVVQYVPGSPGPSEPTAVYYHQDDLFNVVALSDENGQVFERYEYGDYGAPMDESMAQLTSTYPAVPFLFNGRFYDFEIHQDDDGESGWYQYRTREMDPGTGRFTIRDGLGAWGDAANFGSALAFVASAPAARIDPYGLIPMDAPWWPNPSEYWKREQERQQKRREELKHSGLNQMVPVEEQWRTQDDLSQPGRRTVVDWSDLFDQIMNSPPSSTGYCLVSCHGNRKGPHTGDSYLDDYLISCQGRKLDDIRRALKKKCPRGIIIFACNTDVGRDPSEDLIWKDIRKKLGVDVARCQDQFYCPFYLPPQPFWTIYPEWHDPASLYWN